MILIACKKCDVDWYELHGEPSGREGVSLNLLKPLRPNGAIQDHKTCPDCGEALERR